MNKPKQGTCPAMGLTFGGHDAVRPRKRTWCCQLDKGHGTKHVSETGKHVWEGDDGWSLINGIEGEKWPNKARVELFVLRRGL